jgi:hypothetical protein
MYKKPAAGLLLLFIFCSSSLSGQILPSYLIPYVMPYFHKDKIKLFRDFSFDSTTVLMGTNEDTANGMADKRFCFAVNNVNDLKRIKKEWVFSKSANFTYEEAPFTIRLLKNKKLVQTWYIFTGKKGIITNDGLFAFDTLLLSRQAASNGLNFIVQTDSFSTKTAYRAFREKAQQQAALLFLAEPDTLFEGSFEVKPLAKTATENNELAGQNLLERCNQLMGKNKFSLLGRPVAQVQGESPEMVYVVKTNRRQYDLFIDQDFATTAWVPSVFRVTSYWRK